MYIMLRKHTHTDLGEHMVHHAQTHWQQARNARAHDAYALSERLAQLTEKQQ